MWIVEASFFSLLSLVLFIFRSSQTHEWIRRRLRKHTNCDRVRFGAGTLEFVCKFLFRRYFFVPVDCDCLVVRFVCLPTCQRHSWSSGLSQFPYGNPSGIRNGHLNINDDKNVCEFLYILINTFASCTGVECRCGQRTFRTRVSCVMAAYACLPHI